MGFWVSTLSMMGPKSTNGFHQILTLFLLIVIVSCCLLSSDTVLTIPVHNLDSLLSHPHCPDSWHWYISSPFMCIMTHLEYQIASTHTFAPAVYLYLRT